MHVSQRALVVLVSIFNLQDFTSNLSYEDTWSVSQLVSISIDVGYKLSL